MQGDKALPQNNNYPKDVSCIPARDTNERMLPMRVSLPISQVRKLGLREAK